MPKSIYEIACDDSVPHFITDSPTILRHKNARSYVLISARDPSGMTEMVPGGEGTLAMQAVTQFRAAGGQSITDTNKTGSV